MHSIDTHSGDDKRTDKQTERETDRGTVEQSTEQQSDPNGNSTARNYTHTDTQLQIHQELQILR